MVFYSVIFIIISTDSYSQKSNADNLKIIHSKIFVDDQDKALKFYTESLGFVLKDDVTNGDYRWLTVVQSDNQEGTQLILEKNDFPEAKAYQEENFKQGAPATMFGISDIKSGYERLKNIGVQFTMEPTDIGYAVIAIIDDTCGNLIQIVQFN